MWFSFIHPICSVVANFIQFPSGKSVIYFICLCSGELSRYCRNMWKYSRKCVVSRSAKSTCACVRRMSLMRVWLTVMHRPYWPCEVLQIESKKTLNKPRKITEQRHSWLVLTLRVKFGLIVVDSDQRTSYIHCKVSCDVIFKVM